MARGSASIERKRGCDGCLEMELRQSYKIGEVDVCGHHMFILRLECERGVGILGKSPELHVVWWCTYTSHFITQSY